MNGLAFDRFKARYALQIRSLPALFGLALILCGFTAGLAFYLLSKPEPFSPPGCGAMNGKPRQSGLAIAANAVLFASPTDDVRISGSLKFKSRVEYGPMANGRVLVKAQDGRSSFCGWLPAAFIVTGVHPLAAEGPEFKPGAKPAKNPLFMKVLVKPAPGVAPAPVPLYTRPTILDSGQPADADTYRIADARISGIFFVYKVYVPEAAGSLGMDDAARSSRWLYIAGSSPFEAASLSGWIREDNVYLWGTQISLYFNPASHAQTAVYADLAGAQTGDASKKIGSRPAWDLAPKDRNVLRFPVLDAGSGDSGQLAGAAGAVYRIGYYALGCQSDAECMSRVAAGFVKVNRKERDMVIWASFQPKLLQLLSFAAESFCEALQGSDARARFEFTLSQLAQVTGDDLYDPKGETISEFLARLFHLPKEIFSKALNRTADDFFVWWGGIIKQGMEGANSTERQLLRASVCRSAYLLNLVKNNETIELVELNLFNAQTGKWELAPGVKARHFTWLWQPENGLALYFVPVAYLPGTLIDKQPGK